MAMGNGRGRMGVGGLFGPGGKGNEAVIMRASEEQSFSKKPVPEAAVSQGRSRTALLPPAGFLRSGHQVAPLCRTASNPGAAGLARGAAQYSRRRCLRLGRLGTRGEVWF